MSTTTSMNGQQSSMNGEGTTRTSSSSSSFTAAQNSSKWTTAKDPISGRTYYYHVETRQTQWNRPPGMGPAKKDKSKQRFALIDGGSSHHHSSGNTTTDGFDESSSGGDRSSKHVQPGANGAAARSGSVLNKHDDPFAPRKGKALVWKNVNMTLSASGDEPPRQLLQDVWGEVPARETTAIMGPSGAGKTSLLNILAGRASSHGRIKIKADIRLDNYAVNPQNIDVRKKIAFVAQDDSLQVTATPREAIRFSAKLRLPRSTTESQLQKLTKRMIKELGLTACADTIVGGSLIKGISGGERKRTSVGVELVVKPALVFLDEPTSGLDSFSAVQLCQVLKKVANAGASVLFTIHQPSSEIFNSFDHLILLNKGRVMYQGEVANVPEYFAARGRPNPPNFNPGDWIMNVAQSTPLETLDREGFFAQDTRDIGEPFTPEEGKDALGMTITRRSIIPGQAAVWNDKQPGILTQINLLFTREINNLSRDITAVGARFGLTTFLSILIGFIFFDVGNTDSSVQVNLQSHFGALLMVLLMSMFGTASPSLLAFPSERPVMIREYSTNHYSIVSYFMCRLTIEAFITALQILVMSVITYFMIGVQCYFVVYFLTIYALAMSSTALAVFLGCSVEDPKLAQEMLPILFVPQILFAGFFVAPGLIPAWIAWARYLCSLTYGVRIMVIAEFYDCDPDDPKANANCNNLVRNVDAHPDDTWWYWLVLIGLFAFFRLTGLFVLRRKAVKFF